MARIASVDPTQSQISTNKSAIATDGVESCTVFVTAKQNRLDANNEAMPFGQGLAASDVVITVTPSTGVTITQPTGTVNNGGAVTGSFVSTSAATVSVNATVRGQVLTSGAATVVVGGGAPPEPDEGDPFFEETFAGNQLNNADGFTWGGGKNTSVVTFDAAPALRFRYDPASGSPNAEHRFNLGRDCPHLWLEYQIYIPANFSHANDSPSNNKFAMFWRDTYSDVAGGTWRVGFEFQTTSTRTPDSNIRAMSSRWNLNSWTSSNSTGDYLPTGQNAKFISSTGPLTIDAWNTVRIELAAASNQSSSDGIQRMWINGTLFVEITTGKFWNFDTATDPVDCHIRNGYFMGTANSDYPELTDFHLRGFKFYNTDPGWL